MATLFNDQKNRSPETEEKSNKLWNKSNVITPVAPNGEAQLHNAQISENYRLLKDAVERQIATFDFETQPRASVITPERPMERVQEVQAPRDRVSDLFTTDTLDRALRNNAPEIPTAPMDYVQQNNDVENVAEQESVFGLSAMAKAIAAVFCAVIVTMLTMISINTQIINEKATKLAELERQQRTLIQRSVKLKNQIEDATSDETIKEFAEQFGMVKVD